MDEHYVEMLKDRIRSAMLALIAAIMCINICVAQQEVIPGLRLDAPSVFAPSIERGASIEANGLQYNRSAIIRDLDTLNYVPLRRHTYSFYNMKSFHLPGDMVFRQDPFVMDYDIYGGVRLWDGGGIIGSGSYNNFPGMGSLQTASIGVTQSFGNLDMTVGLMAEKIFMPYSLRSRIGGFTSTTYNINEKWRISMFGTFMNGYNNTMLPPGLLPMAGFTSYGATVGWNVSEKFTVEAGAQRVYNAYTRRWEVVPIFIPTVNIGKAHFGMDVGGILYNVLRGVAESVNSKNNSRINPREIKPVNTRSGERAVSHNGWDQRMYHK